VAVYVTVAIDRPAAEVQAVEAANASVLAPIVAAARRHGATHTRLVRDGRVLDLERFADRAAYDRFSAEAADAIAAYADLFDGAVEEVVWTAS